jgi:hypothetical protein
MNIVKSLLIVIVFIIVLFYVIGFLAWKRIKFDLFTPEVDMISIHSDRFEETLYIKRMVWGMTGDNQVIVISKSSRKETVTNPNEEFVFQGLGAFYWKYSDDTLEIYYDSKFIPPARSSIKIFIRPIKLNNEKMSVLLNSYRNMGLSTFAKP